MPAESKWHLWDKEATRYYTAFEPVTLFVDASVIAGVCGGYVWQVAARPDIGAGQCRRPKLGWCSELTGAIEAADCCATALLARLVARAERKAKRKEPRDV